MSKLDEKLSLFQKEMTTKLGMTSVDVKLLTAIAKSLGPSLYKTDSEKVACSDNKELDRVKQNFVIKKLGLKDDASLDAEVKKVCEQMGATNRNKYRVIFYYLLVKNLKKESVFN